ncbi:MAG: TetR/AcrR family transcriptional regulator [Streptosporangiaceae bacterium]
MATTSQGPAFEDLTARARIRDAALGHFAEYGFARATIRGIAQSAGVSLGLVRHHFGSKEALRQACDEYVMEATRQYNQQSLAGGPPDEAAFAAASRSAMHPLFRYVARALIDGSVTAANMFDEMVGMTEQWLVRRDQDRGEPPLADARSRAALITAMAVGIPLLHEHLSRALATDIFGPEGDRRVALGLLDIYSHSLISAEYAAASQAAFDKPHP